MFSRILETEETAAFARVVWCPAAGDSRPAHAPARKPKMAAQQPCPESRIAELKAQMAARIAEAQESGYREGRAAAEAQAAKTVQDAVERLGTALANLVHEREELIKKSEADLVRLSIEVARRVLHRELTVDPAALEGLVKVATKKLQGHEAYSVRVHPEHVNAIRACLQKWGKAAQIEVIGDAGQELGGAIFELSNGKLDASIETQLREIELGLADRFQG